MLVLYYSWFLIFSMTLINSVKTSVNIKCITFIYTCFILIILSGFKTIGVGVDDFGYVESFKLGFIDDNFEKGYSFLSYIIYVIFREEQFLFIIISSISILSLGYSIYKLSPYPVLSLLMYYTYYYIYKDLTQIRNAVSSSLLFLLLYFLSKNQKIKVFFAFLLSISFHIVSSLSIIPVLLINSFKNKTNRLIYIFILSIPILYFLSKYTITLLSNIPFDYISKKMYDYLNSDYTQSIELINIKNLQILVITIFSIMFYGKTSLVVKNYVVILVFYLFGVFLRFGLINYGIFSGRTASFFLQFDILLIPFFIYTIKNKYLRYFTIVFISILTFFVLYYNLEKQHVINHYSNILFE